MTPPQVIIPFLISFLIMTTLALFAWQRRAGAGHHFNTICRKWRCCQIRQCRCILAVTSRHIIALKQNR
jgi:hypothetical protein